MKRQPVKPLTPAAQELALSHIDQARLQANCHYRRLSHAVPLEELEGAAVLALCRSAVVHDPARGPFENLARHAMRNALLRAADLWLRGGRLAFLRFSEVSEHGLDAVDERSHRGDAEAAELVRLCQRSLTPRQWTVLWCHYALGMTLNEVGQKLGGLSRQAVCQIKKKALSRARIQCRCT